MNIELVYLLITGLAMSFTHCPLMCGALAAKLPHMWAYQLSRSAGYCLLCALVFALKSSLALSASAAALAMFAAGCVLLLIAAALAFRGALLRAVENRFLSSKISAILLICLRQKSALAIAAVGFINAFLPCGLVYFYLASAMIAPDIAHALAIGLLCALVSSASLYASRLVLRAAFWRYFAPALIAAQGVYLALKGVMLYE